MSKLKSNNKYFVLLLSRGTQIIFVTFSLEVRTKINGWEFPSVFRIIAKINEISIRK